MHVIDKLLALVCYCVHRKDFQQSHDAHLKERTEALEAKYKEMEHKYKAELMAKDCEITKLKAENQWLTSRLDDSQKVSLYVCDTVCHKRPLMELSDGLCILPILFVGRRNLMSYEPICVMLLRR